MILHPNNPMYLILGMVDKFVRGLPPPTKLNMHIGIFFFLQMVGMEWRVKKHLQSKALLWECHTLVLLSQVR